MNIAFEGSQIVIELQLHVASSDMFGLMLLSAMPQAFFVLPTAAECTTGTDNNFKFKSHPESHVKYVWNLTCSNPDAVTGIEFTYFDLFEDAHKLEVQIVTSSGVQASEIERDSPSLDLSGMF